MIHAGDNRGVTLIELLIVVSIIGILIIALGFSFQGWMGGYKVESTTKQIYVDLMNARARAMQSNREHFVDFPTTLSYRVIEDTNENNAPNPGAGDTIIDNLSKTVEYDLIVALTSGTTITFNTRGIISPRGSIRLTLPAGITPDYDCVEFIETRMNLGIWNAGTSECDAK